jgi:hypothetical protein
VRDSERAACEQSERRWRLAVRPMKFRGKNAVILLASTAGLIYLCTLFLDYSTSYWVHRMSKYLSNRSLTGRLIRLTQRRISDQNPDTSRPDKSSVGPATPSSISYGPLLQQELQKAKRRSVGVTCQMSSAFLGFDPCSPSALFGCKLAHQRFFIVILQHPKVQSV